MKLAILGAGHIAKSMAKTVLKMKEVELYAIASRNKERSENFAKEFNIPNSFDSYEKMLSDPKIDLVYIAVPHSHHYKWTIEALNHGKNVLCEKAFAVNEKQASEMIALAKEKNLLLAEAIWTRYMPSRKIIENIIQSGEIGEVFTLSANLGYIIDDKERLIRPELAGGALLDVGIYTLNFASMVFGDKIKRIAASCVMTESGVDGQDSIMIQYNNNCMATLFCSMYTQTDRRGIIYGRKGFIKIDNINNPLKIKVVYNSRRLPKYYKVPHQISGYEYQVRSCVNAINEHKTECPEMPHEETLEMMRQMDEIRKQIGLIYPCE